MRNEDVVNLIVHWYTWAVCWDVFGLEVKPKNHRQFVTDDPEISQLSKKQKELRIQMMTALPRDRARLRRERYHILRRLPMLVKKRMESVLQAKAEAVEKLHNDGAKMFAAVKERKLQNVAYGIMVNNIAEERTVDPNEQVSRVSRFFEGQFKSPNAQDLDALVSRPLCHPITPEEVFRAMKTLKSHRACGADKIPNELLKYGGFALAAHIAGVLNDIFERGEVNSTIGQGVLIPLQKPGKPKGELKSLRPVVLLNSICKVFSLVVLERVREQVDRYLPTSQSAFWKGCSMADVVFAKHALTDMVQDKVTELHILGIDLSRAFDTVDRH